MKNRFWIVLVLVFAPTLRLTLGEALTEAEYTGDRLIGQNFPISIIPGSNQVSPSISYNNRDNSHLVVWVDDKHVINSGLDIYGRLIDSDGRAIGMEFPISTARNNQEEPSVAYNSRDNQFLVVWKDFRNYETSGSDLYGQIVASDGTLIGRNFPISTASRDQGTPSVTYNSSDHQYFVVWEDSRSSPSEIYGQLLGPNGALLGDNFLISIDHEHLLFPRFHSPHLTHNSQDNEYLVVWWTTANFGGTWIHGQRVARDGNLLGNSFRISRGSPFPSIAYNTQDNQYLVVWRDNLGIRGRRIAHDGNLLGEDFLISSTRSSMPSSLAYNIRTNQYLVVWLGLAYDGIFGWNVYGQMVNSDGNLIGDSFAISTAPNPQINLKVNYNDHNNQYLIVWADLRDRDKSGWDVYGQRADFDGRLIGIDFRVSPDPDLGPGPAPGRQIRPSITYNSRDDQYLIVWEDSRRGFGLYGQIVNGDASLSRVGFQISFAGYNAGVAYNSQDNQYLVVWNESRDSFGLRIYGQLLNADGSLIGEDFLISMTSQGDYKLSVVYNDRDNQYLAIWTFFSQRVLGQIVSNDGKLIGENLLISTDRIAQAPSLTYNGQDNRYLVVWEDHTNSLTSGMDVYGQFVDSNGMLLGRNFPVSTAPEDQRRPSVTYNVLDNQYFVVWGDNRNFTTRNWEVFGQLLDRNGRLLGENFPIALAPRRGLAGSPDPKVTYNGRDNLYLVIWHDERNLSSRSDIFGRMVSSDGSLPGEDFQISLAPPPNYSSDGWPSLTYNSQSNQYIVVWDDARSFATSQWDIYGQIVR